MIVYKDITFCADSFKCKNESGCHRAYTDEVREAAMKVKLPISLGNNFECFEGEERNENK